MKRKIENALCLMREQVGAWGLDLAQDQETLLGLYAEILADYDRANVIGTKDPSKILLEHVTDALSCISTGHITPSCRLVDVGAGGGLPGIPLGIACRNARLTLVESASKKVRFLETAVEELGLHAVSVEQKRAEHAGREAKHRDAFDVAVARAVAALPVVAEYCAPLVKTGGHVIAMKARLAPSELAAGQRAAVALGARLERVMKIDFLPAMIQKERNLVLFRKETCTPRAFPRRVGIARQKPLGTDGGR